MALIHESTCSAVLVPFESCEHRNSMSPGDIICLEFELFDAVHNPPERSHRASGPMVCSIFAAQSVEASGSYACRCPEPSNEPSKPHTSEDAPNGSCPCPACRWAAPGPLILCCRFPFFCQGAVVRCLMHTLMWWHAGSAGCAPGAQVHYQFIFFIYVFMRLCTDYAPTSSDYALTS